MVNKITTLNQIFQSCLEVNMLNPHCLWVNHDISVPVESTAHSTRVPNRFPKCPAYNQITRIRNRHNYCILSLVNEILFLVILDYISVAAFEFLLQRLSFLNEWSSFFFVLNSNATAFLAELQYVYTRAHRTGGVFSAICLPAGLW